MGVTMVLLLPPPLALPRCLVSFVDFFLLVRNLRSKTRAASATIFAYPSISALAASVGVVPSSSSNPFILENLCLAAMSAQPVRAYTPRTNASGSRKVGRMDSNNRGSYSAAEGARDINAPSEQAIPSSRRNPGRVLRSAEAMLLPSPPSSTSSSVNRSRLYAYRYLGTGARARIVGIWNETVFPLNSHEGIR